MLVARYCVMDAVLVLAMRCGAAGKAASWGQVAGERSDKVYARMSVGGKQERRQSNERTCLTLRRHVARHIAADDGAPQRRIQKPDTAVSKQNDG